MIVIVIVIVIVIMIMIIKIIKIIKITAIIVLSCNCVRTVWCMGQSTVHCINLHEILSAIGIIIVKSYQVHASKGPLRSLL